MSRTEVDDDGLVTVDLDPSKQPSRATRRKRSQPDGSDLPLLSKEEGMERVKANSGTNESLELVERFNVLGHVEIGLLGWRL